jgi:hypothetical protein
MEGWKARVRLRSTQKKCLHFDSSDVEKKNVTKYCLLFATPSLEYTIGILKN